MLAQPHAGSMFAGCRQDDKNNVRTCQITTYTHTLAMGSCIRPLQLMASQKQKAIHRWLRDFTYLYELASCCPGNDVHEKGHSPCSANSRTQPPVTQSCNSLFSAA